MAFFPAVEDVTAILRFDLFKQGRRRFGPGASYVARPPEWGRKPGAGHMINGKMKNEMIQQAILQKPSQFRIFP